jgi:hypothetical protein
VGPVFRAEGAAVRDQKDAVAASIASLADLHGIAVLRGGGSVFARHGLVSPRVSPAVAIIVEPTQCARFGGLLRGNGWELTRPTAQRGPLPSPVLSFSAERFGGTVEVFEIIPGFFADPVEVFAAFWESRDVMLTDGVLVPIFDRLTTVILAVHDRLSGVRWSLKSPDHFAFFLAQFQAVLTDVDRARLLDLLEVVGGTGELGELLDGLGLEYGPPAEPTPAYVRWRLAIPKAHESDARLLSLLERPDGARRLEWREPGLVAASARLRGARRRVELRQGLA